MAAVAPDRLTDPYDLIADADVLTETIVLSDEGPTSTLYHYIDSSVYPVPAPATTISTSSMPQTDISKASPSSTVSLGVPPSSAAGNPATSTTIIISTSAVQRGESPPGGWPKSTTILVSTLVPLASIGLIALLTFYLHLRRRARYQSSVGSSVSSHNRCSHCAHVERDGKIDSVGLRLRVLRSELDGTHWRRELEGSNPRSIDQSSVKEVSTQTENW